jgi:hypothetical protein
MSGVNREEGKDGHHTLKIFFYLTLLLMGLHHAGEERGRQQIIQVGFFSNGTTSSCVPSVVLFTSASGMPSPSWDHH